MTSYIKMTTHKNGTRISSIDCELDTHDGTPFSNINEEDFTKELWDCKLIRLRQIKNSEEYKNSLKCFIDNKPVMIEKVMQLILRFKLDYEVFFDGMERIIHRFKSSPWTKKKEDILKDFQSYCIDHVDFKKDNAQIVADWCKSYSASHNHENPFDTLRQHRRTGLFSLFNPPVTDSLRLFEKYLMGTKIPAPLKKLMDGTPTGSFSYANSTTGKKN